MIPVGQQYYSLGMIDESHSSVYTSAPALFKHVACAYLFGPQLGGLPHNFNLVPQHVLKKISLLLCEWCRRAKMGMSDNFTEAAFLCIICAHRGWKRNGDGCTEKNRDLLQYYEPQTT
jgi:hypothetical protein